MKLLFVLVAIAVAAHLSDGADEPKSLHPVLFVPGELGNQIEAKQAKKSIFPSFFGFNKDDWYTIWFSPLNFLPWTVNKWVDTFRLDVDNSTGKPINRPGVQTRVPGFGQTETVEYLNKFKFVYGYADKVIKALVDLGYERGKSVRAAPFDFRLAPVDNPKFAEDVKNLVETLYKENGEKGVIIISHSTGSRFLYYILSQQTPEWKQKYVSRWVTIAGSFGGEAVSLATLTAGVYDGYQGLSRKNVRTLFRSFSSFAFGSPDPLAYKDAVIVQYKDKNYTAADLSQIFELVGHDVGVSQLERVRSLITNLDAPGVKVTCVRGTETPTIERIIYKDEGKLLDGAELVRGDGDGNVNTVSAAICENWSSTEGFESKVFAKVKHLDLLRDQRVLKVLTETISRVNQE